MLDVLTRLGVVKIKTAEALRATAADPGLGGAAVREFDTMAGKAIRQPQGDGSARNTVIELGLAGDSAKAAVESDPELAGRTSRQCVTPT